MKSIVVYLLFLSVSCLIKPLNAQSISEIKDDPKTYIWGEGKGVTLHEADQMALQMLINQVSATVESRYTLFKEELTSTNRTNDYYEEKYNALINTYSSATLRNTERLVLSNEPDAHVFRYIMRSEIDKIFAHRRSMIYDLVALGQNAQKDLRIADAIRNYYWALSLLKSHPDGSGLKYNVNGNPISLVVWLPEQMNQIFDGLKFNLNKIDSSDARCRFVFNITYNNKPVTNLDYAFYDGRDWSNLYSARNGVGFADLYGEADNLKELKVKVEYLYNGEARSNKEVERVLSQLPVMPFRKSYLTVSLTKKKGQTQAVAETAINKDKAIEKTLSQTLSVLKTKSYEKAGQFCSKDGLKSFTELLAYGKATLLKTDNITVHKENGITTVRGITMAFQFKTNHRNFVENIVLELDDNNKISNVTFSLSEKALNNINSKTFWDLTQRQILIHFLEQYKTAYALKQLDYIESIFADDALIITGTKLKVAKGVENRFKNNSIIQYNRKSKDQYVRDLRQSFASKEYINLKFEESSIRSAGNDSAIYGIQIKQHYFSSNYGDSGYLFLMVDLSDTDKPIIHVRTWQPEKNADGSVYGVGDFF